MIFSFEKLYIYQRSIDFLDRMDRILGERLPEGSRELVATLRQACLSIPTWIAAGNSRRGRDDRKDCYRKSRAAAFTCVPCVEILARRGRFPPPVSEAIRDELFCITRMISALIHSQDRLPAQTGSDGDGGANETPFEARQAVGPT